MDAAWREVARILIQIQSGSSVIQFNIKLK